MADESEEFQFRARLEREKAAAAAAPKPAAASPDAGLRDVALDEPNPHLAAAGGAMASIGEGVGQKREHLVGWLAEKLGAALGSKDQSEKVKSSVKSRLEGVDENVRSNAKARDVLGEQHPLTRITATGTDLALGAALPGLKAAEGATAGGRIASNALTGGMFGLTSPITEKGDFGRRTAMQGTGGALAGGAVGTAMEAPGVMGWLRGLFKRDAPQAVEKTGAPDRVVGELQRQRNVAEGTDKKPGSSLPERAQTDFDERMKPLKDAAFTSNDRVDLSKTTELLDDMVAKNPSPKVREALERVRATIKNATGGDASKGMTSGQRAQWGDFLKGRQPQGVSVQMADEVRQEINRLIEQKGDAALDGHTKDLLGNLRNSLMGSSTDAHRKWVAAEAAGRKDLEQFKPGASVLKGTTTDTRGAQPKSGADAEAVMEGVFSGKTNVADLKDLVERTKHSPELQADVRRSLAEWINKPDPVSKVASSKSMIERWEKAKGAVESSGMMPKEHVQAVDKVMDDLREVRSENRVQKAWTTVGGFIAGTIVGHPFMGAHLARDAVAKNQSTNAAQEEVTRIISSLALRDEEIARTMALPPSKDNFDKIMDRLDLPANVRKALTIEAARANTQPQKKPGVLSMHPAGL